MLKTDELRNLSEEELHEKADSLKKDLMHRRFEAKTGKLERQSTIRELKRDIARIFTIVNEKKQEAEVKS